MTTAPLDQPTITLDALMAMGEDARVEVINGEIIPMSPVGGTHQFVAFNTMMLLNTYVREHQLGIVLQDGMLFRMGYTDSNLKNALVPDVSFIAWETIPEDWNRDRPFPGSPNLAVEVISPSETSAAINTKVKAYLERGTSEVWVVYPDSQQIYQYRQQTPDTVRIYQRNEERIASDLFPELELTVAAVFSMENWK